MKKFTFLQSIAAILGLLIVIGVGCSKDNHRDQVQMPEAEFDPAGLITGFSQKMDDYKKGVFLKNSESILIDSAIWYIDATLNYYYAMANYPCARFHWDTVFVEMNVLDSYEAMYAEVFEAYDSTLYGISDKYYEIEEDEKQFLMAMVEDMGSLPDNNRSLRIITITGTGTLEHSGDFGDQEAYSFEDFTPWGCFGNLVGTNAPEVFEALLYQHYNTDPINCRWYFYGATDSMIVNYLDHPLNSTLVNYLDYKIFAASEAVAPFDNWTECLEYNYNNSGIHEMQFYYDHKKGFINTWVNSSQNTGNKKFAGSLIKSEDQNPNGRNIWHVPTFYFRQRHLACTVPITPPER